MPFNEIIKEAYVNPTIFRDRGYRFYFFSREERRMHVHVTCDEGEAKFWLEPCVEIADYTGLSERQLNKIEKIVKENANEFKENWKEHFKS